MINFATKLKPSIYACVISLILHALISYIIIFYIQNLVIKVITLLLILASLVFSLRIYSLKSKNSLQTLRFNQASGLSISFDGLEYQQVAILANSYLTPWFILLNIQISNKRLSQLIALDMLTRQDFKRLLMILRSNRPNKPH